MLVGFGDFAIWAYASSPQTLGPKPIFFVKVQKNHAASPTMLRRRVRYSPEHGNLLQGLRGAITEIHWHAIEPVRSRWVT